MLRNTEVCISLSPGDAVFTQGVLSGRNGTSGAIPATNVLAGAAPLPISVSLFTAPAGGAVMAGVPRIEITITDTLGALSDPDNVIIFVGTGRTFANSPGVWDLADNQVQPLRGVGTHEINLPGIGERLAAGEQAGILFYGLHEQFAATGGVNAANPVIGAVTVEGTGYLPILNTQVTQ